MVVDIGIGVAKVREAEERRCVEALHCDVNVPVWEGTLVSLLNNRNVCAFAPLSAPPYDAM